MRFMHLSDLHIGKRVNDFSMIEDQKYIFKEILKLIQEQNIEGIFIAGDVYDKAVPSAEAVDLFDDFLTELSEQNLPVFIISGNHDSPERLDFGNRIMGKHQIYIAGEYNGQVTHIILEDTFGPINIYMMPFLKPAYVNRKLSLETNTYDECVREALKVTLVNTQERNILLAHQFVTVGGNNPETSDSESKSLGGIDNVDVSAFDDFDYVALGHIHRPQKMGRDTIRYCGSPLKYSFSECNHHKSVTILDFKDKENLTIELVELKPQRDMIKIRCTLEELTKGKTFEQAPRDSYVQITLTDEDEIIDAIGKVREIYPNIMLLDFDNQRTKENLNRNLLTGDDIKEKTPEELFADFYFYQNNEPMKEIQRSVLNEVLKKIGGRAV